MSDVETFFYKIQEKLGGNLRWEDLMVQDQLVFIQAINIIKSIGEIRK
jgi:hypothetical protein